MVLSSTPLTARASIVFEGTPNPWLSLSLLKRQLPTRMRKQKFPPPTQLYVLGGSVWGPSGRYADLSLGLTGTGYSGTLDRHWFMKSAGFWASHTGRSHRSAVRPSRCQPTVYRQSASLFQAPKQFGHILRCLHADRPRFQLLLFQATEPTRRIFVLHVPPKNKPSAVSGIIPRLYIQRSFRENSG
jgi:hypothetical protein